MLIFVRLTGDSIFRTRIEKDARISERIILSSLNAILIHSDSSCSTPESSRYSRMPAADKLTFHLRHGKFPIAFCSHPIEEECHTPLFRPYFGRLNLHQFSPFPSVIRSSSLSAVLLFDFPFLSVRGPDMRALFQSADLVKSTFPHSLLRK